MTAKSKEKTQGQTQGQGTENSRPKCREDNFQPIFVTTHYVSVRRPLSPQPQSLRYRVAVAVTTQAE